MVLEIWTLCSIPWWFLLFGILCCIIVSFYGVYIKKVEQESEIESSLKNQLLFSSILLTPAIIGAAYLNLPEDFMLGADKKHAW